MAEVPVGWDRLISTDRPANRQGRCVENAGEARPAYCDRLFLLPVSRVGPRGTKQLECGVSLYGVGLMTVDLRLEYTVRTCELEAEHGCY